jgi:DNA-binding IclR family transcriptional regulator
MRTRRDVTEGRAPAASRAAEILWHLSLHPQGQKVTEVARSTGLLPSTCLRILRELVAAGLVSLSAGGKQYRLGKGILTLSSRMCRTDAFIQNALPTLDHLSRSFGVLSVASELDLQDHIVICASSTPSGSMFPSAHSGARFPSLAGATGRLVAAFGVQSAQMLKSRFDLVRWHKAPSFATWLQEVEVARKTGVAVDEGNLHKDHTVLAVPILSSDMPMSRFIAVLAETRLLTDSTRANISHSLKSFAKVLKVSASCSSGVDLRIQTQLARYSGTSHLSYQSDPIRSEAGSG